MPPIIQEEDNNQFKPFSSSTTTEPYYRQTCNKTELFKRKIDKMQLTQRFFVKMYTGKPCPEGTRNHT